MSIFSSFCWSASSFSIHLPLEGGKSSVSSTEEFDGSRVVPVESVCFLHCSLPNCQQFALQSSTVHALVLRRERFPFGMPIGGSVESVGAGVK